MKKVFVTGGTGLLGARLIQELIATDSYEIHALKRTHSDLSLLAGLEDQIHWIEGDMLDQYALEQGLANAAIVFHCAAMVSFDPRDREHMHEVNVAGTALLVDLCIGREDLKLIHVSSIAAVGHEKDPNRLISEVVPWEEDENRSEYSKSKYFAEMEVHRGIAEGIRAAIVNPSIILGLGFPAKGSTRMFANVRKGFPYYTEGISGFVHAEDVARFMLLLAASEIEGERYILSQGNYSYKQVFDWMAEGFKVAKPNKPVNRLISALVWRLDKVRCLFTGARPLVTKETTASAFAVHRYDNTKSLAFPGFTYGNLQEQISRSCQILEQSLLLA